MILKTLESLGPVHAYGLARRIEQTSGDVLEVAYGTIYPAVIKLEQEGFVSAGWGVSDNNRRARYYRLTAAGKRRLRREERQWTQTVNIVGCFLNSGEESA
jgi:transcriptional regulator